jgi:hypothetical protein
MKTYLIIGILVLTAFSCGKDKIENRPRLTLNSVSSTTVPNGFDLQVKMRLTDKQGDFYDTIWVRKITTRCPSSNFADSLLYRVPNDLPRTNNFDGELIVTFQYAVALQPRCPRPDTAVFSIWMKDKEGNKSDTVRTEPIIILR